MTLRFSDGLVKGYEYNGTLAPWATTFYGLYARGIEFGNEYPFDIPQPWLAKEGASRHEEARLLREHQRHRRRQLGLVRRRQGPATSSA